MIEVTFCVSFAKLLLEVTNFIAFCSIDERGLQTFRSQNFVFYNYLAGIITPYERNSVSAGCNKYWAEN